MYNFLTDSGLFRSECFIDGNWCGADDGAVFEVTNPYDGQCIGTVPRMGALETERAIAAAGKAWENWRELPPAKRGEFLLAWHALIETHKQDLARLLTLEQGKPVAESLGEIALGASYLPWYTEECRRTYGDVIPAPRPGIQPITHRRPVGVVAAISPWNFPMSMLTRKVAAALAAGCTVVAKPASATPYSALALAELAQRAGIPRGVLNILTGSAPEIGAAIARNPAVRKVTFTGSTEVGKQLMISMSATMKRLSLELGGNAPFVIFDDADIDTAVNACMASKFRNSGQTCVCANRILMQISVHDICVQRLIDRIRPLKIGNGLESGVDIGPLINEDAVLHCEALVKDAVDKGGRILLGGKRLTGTSFFEPTVLTGMTPDMRVFREEIFGPIVPVMAFETEAEAIALSNDTQYGLASYICTRDLSRTLRVSAALEFGMVGVNEAGLAMAEVPFGGIKESGTGREGGHEGLLDFMETRYTLLGGL